jgi:hypothetical protein
VQKATFKSKWKVGGGTLMMEIVFKYYLEGCQVRSHQEDERRTQVWRYRIIQVIKMDTCKLLRMYHIEPMWLDQRVPMGSSSEV